MDHISLNDLTQIEVTILAYLNANRGVPQSAKTICMAVFGDNIGRDASLKTHLSNLRSKLPADNDMWTIRTTRGEGWWLPTQNQVDAERKHGWLP